MASRTLESTERAAKLWLGGMSIDKASKECGITFSTLSRHIRKKGLEQSYAVKKKVALANIK